MDYVKHIHQAFEKTERLESNLIDEIIMIEGMSGLKTRHLYNNLVNMDDARYLEIGCWRGSTLVSAMYKNKATLFAIDNFSEFNDSSIEKDLMNNISKFQGENTVTFLKEDSFKVDVKSLPKFNIYMYDGDHSKESHKKALTHFYDCLDHTFIYIVDDWNWQQVKIGTIEAIHELGLHILDRNQKESGPSPDGNGYWNGVMVCVLQKSNPTQSNTD